MLKEGKSANKLVKVVRHNNATPSIALKVILNDATVATITQDESRMARYSHLEIRGRKAEGVLSFKEVDWTRRQENEAFRAKGESNF